MNTEIAMLVRSNIEFFNLNKTAEARFGISLIQYYLLIILRDMPGCSPQQLAEAAGTHPSSLTQSLKRLQRKKAIFITNDPRDARKKLLSLTRNGQKILLVSTSGIQSILKEFRNLRTILNK